jgi:hypothetical protein
MRLDGNVVRSNSIAEKGDAQRLDRFWVRGNAAEVPGQVSFPSLPSPVVIPLADTFVVPATLDQENGRQAVEHGVRSGPLRPFDIARADIEEPQALWVPFWRVPVVIDGFHLTFTDVNIPDSGMSLPVPRGGSRFKEAAVMVCARADFPYEPKLPSLFGRVSGVQPLDVDLEAMSSPAVAEMLAANGARVLDADIHRERAEGIVAGVLLESVSPLHAIYEKYEPKIEPARFCLYPLYFARYTYSGEARRHPGESFFIAVSGVTGQVVTARYPSVARSVAAKVRRLLSADRRM